MTHSGLLLSELEQQKYDNAFWKLYGNQNGIVSEQRNRYADAIIEFTHIFGEDMIEIYSAPGRTEICGNHTDHQHGMVLAASIHLDTIAVVSKNDSSAIDFVSKGYAPIHITLSDLENNPAEAGTTKALIKGVLKGFLNAGFNIGGFKAYVTSDVLSGSGLSSSAAIETIIGTILSGLYNDMSVSPIDIAKIGQFAENHYFGKPCGLMDQIACSVGDFVFIDFSDSNHPEIKKTEFDLNEAGYTLCIIDTKGSHADLTDDYASIPLEMKQVASYFGKEYLKDVTMEEFMEHYSSFAQKVSNRALLRAIHFFTENKRVKEAVLALQQNDIASFLDVIRRSGDSSYKYLQNVYSNHNIHTQPIPVALALSEQYLQNNGVCRVHGGGFAGTIQAFVKNEIATDFKNHMEGFLGKNTCHILGIRKVGGIKVL